MNTRAPTILDPEIEHRHKLLASGALVMVVGIVLGTIVGGHMGTLVAMAICIPAAPLLAHALLGYAVAYKRI